MTQAEKFQFQTEFDSVEPGRAPRRVKPRSYSAAELAEARDAALAEGREQGLAEAAAGTATAVAQCLQSLTQQFAELAEGQRAAAKEARGAAARLAWTAASTLARSLMTRHPLSEIEGLIGDCLAELGDEPAVVVRAAEPVVEALSHEIDRVVQQAGFGGKLILLPDDTVGAHDCRVEWADGGVELKPDEVARRVAQAVERYLASPTATAETIPAQGTE